MCARACNARETNAWDDATHPMRKYNTLFHLSKKKASEGGSRAAHSIKQSCGRRAVISLFPNYKRVH